MPTPQEVFEGLRDQIVGFAITNELTSSQVFAATRIQIGDILGIAPSDPVWEYGNSGRFENLRYHAAVKLREQEDQTILLDFLEYIGNYLSSRFPNIDYEKQRVDGRRILSIHFDGIPEEIV